MVDRFQVMAMLQAARAYRLGFSLDEAKSYGLNRAIFYAAAKKGFKGGSSKHVGAKQTFRQTPWKQMTKTLTMDGVGNEQAYCVNEGGKRRFVMGDKIIEPKDYNRQIENRFTDYDHAWHEAMSLIEHTNPEILESQRKFYETVYKPHRDELVHRWSAAA